MNKGNNNKENSLHSSLWPIMTLVLSFITGTAGIYFGAYTEQNMAQRDELAKDLAEFYSSSASEFYAQRELLKAQNGNLSSPYFIELHREEDLHYREFLLASTKLETEAPPELRGEILKIEDAFDKLGQQQSDKTESDWFAQLDAMRNKVLDDTNFQRPLFSFWREPSINGR